MIVKNKQTGIYDEKELTQHTLLCNSNGHLMPDAVGWSRHPLHTCNLSGNWLRKKKWNYWCIFAPDYLFSITLANADYLGLAFGYFLEYKTKRFVDKTVKIPLGKGCNMPETVNGNISFCNKHISLSFIKEQSSTKISVESSNFGNTKLSADLVVEHQQVVQPASAASSVVPACLSDMPACQNKEIQSMNVVIPWNKYLFHFTSKQNCLPAKGTVTLWGETFPFDSANSFAILDFGRGIWPYFTFWNWASCSGKHNGRTIGLNLGAGWTKGSGMTENAIYTDGTISKLSEDVIFSYDTSNFMNPWTIKTKISNRVDIQFVPFYKRTEGTDLLILKSAVHQMFGYFSGTIVPDNGEIINFDSIVGLAEEHYARW